MPKTHDRKTVLTAIVAALCGLVLGASIQPHRWIDTVWLRRADAQAVCPAVSNGTIPRRLNNKPLRLVGSTPVGLLFETDDVIEIVKLSPYTKDLESGSFEDCALF